MKHIVPIFLTLCLLAGCAASPPPPDEQTVLEAYSAAAEVYDSFDLHTLPTGIEAIQLDSNVYYPVEYDGITTMADLETRVRACFSPELSDVLLSDGSYREIDGTLCCAGGARGQNVYLLDKTLSARQVDESHWTVTITFWADFVDQPIQADGHPHTVATVGYSQRTLDYEKTDEGWRFTSFCPSDDLDLDAETVFTFCYGPDAFAADESAMDTWSDYKLGCWLLHADALSEGADTLLTQRFLEDPETWFSALAPLAESPLENAQTVVEGPSNVYAWFSTEEQARFEEILDTFQPRDAVQQTMLEDLKAARERAIKLAADDATASFCLVTDGTFLSLGETKGAYPWGNTGFPDSPEPAGTGDNGDTLYTFSFQGVEVTYSAIPDTESCCVFRMFTNTPGPETLGGIQVGSTEEVLLGRYPSAQSYDGLQPSQPVSFDRVYVWEPGGLSYCKHIAFFLKDGIVAAIEIEDLMDGRLLS